MSINLIDAAKGLFNSSLVSNASATLGESEQGISKTLSAIIPTALSGLISKASSTDGANTVANLAKESYNSGILNSVGSLFNGGNDDSFLSKGAGVLGSLFGDKVGGITSLISNFTGVKSSTATSLLGMAVPSILGLLGKHAETNNLSASGLSSFLASQKDTVANALPTGLSLGNLFSGSIPKISSTVSNATNTLNTKNGGNSFGKYLPYLLLLALLAAAIFWWKGCKNNAETTTTTVTTDTSNTTKMEDAAVKGKLDGNDWVYDEGDTVTLSLPNNVGALRVGKYSKEANLFAFLNDVSAKIDTVKGNWFEFTNVHFKTGSSDLTDASMAQLKNMVAISKAYPTATFKFGGYTDSTGSHDANLALSKKRAESVATTVKKLGATEKSIVGAEGYAEAWPLASNATADGRAQNRRVSVRVKSK